jgi:predicted permease
MSVADLGDYRHSQTSFESMAAATRFSQSLSLPVGTQLLTGEAVNDMYFHTLGVTAIAGRVLQPTDVRPDAPPVMVLSHQVWRRWFASDASVVGQTVRFGATPFQIVGVTAREYRGLNAHAGRVTGVWIPLSALSQMPVYGSPADPATARTRQTMLVAGRLRPAVSVSHANAEAATIGSGLDPIFPLTAARWNGTETIRVPGQRQWTLRPIDQAIPSPRLIPGILVGIVALVLVVACTNLANLSLARGASREAELAVRLALGASRGRLIRELCAESLLVGVIGYLVAIPIAAWLMRLAAVDRFVLSGSAAAFDPHLGLPVLAACAIAVVLAVLVCGLWPAMRLSRTDVRSAIAKGGAIVSPSWRTERRLIGVQTVISVTLFCSAAGLISALAIQNRMDPGIDLDHLTVARTVFRLQTWDVGRSRRAIDAIDSIAPARFGFRSVALSSSVPFGSNLYVYADISPTAQGVNTRTAALLMASTPRVFDALGLPLVAGRPFDQRDNAGSDPVIVISEHTALTLFGTRDVIGRDVYLRGALNALDKKAIERRRVIGVTKNADLESLPSRRGLLVLVPLAQRYEPPNFVLASRPAKAAGDLRALIRAADPDVAVDATGSGLSMLGGGWVAIRIITGNRAPAGDFYAGADDGRAVWSAVGAGSAPVARDWHPQGHGRGQPRHPPDGHSRWGAARRRRHHRRLVPWSPGRICPSRIDSSGGATLSRYRRADGGAHRRARNPGRVLLSSAPSHEDGPQRHAEGWVVTGVLLPDLVHRGEDFFEFLQFFAVERPVARALGGNEALEGVVRLHCQRGQVGHGQDRLGIGDRGN